MTFFKVFKKRVLPRNLVMFDFEPIIRDEFEDNRRFNERQSELSELIFRFNEILLKRLDNAKTLINEYQTLEKLIWEFK